MTARRFHGPPPRCSNERGRKHEEDGAWRAWVWTHRAGAPQGSSHQASRGEAKAVPSAESSACGMCALLPARLHTIQTNAICRSVDGGVNPRKSGDDRKSGTRFAALDQPLLAIFRSDANGCSVALCQRRQPPKAGAVEHCRTVVRCEAAKQTFHRGISVTSPMKVHS